MSLPSDYGQTVPYMLVMDRVPVEFGETARESWRGLSQSIVEASGGQCHGFLMVEGELEIE